MALDRYRVTLTRDGRKFGILDCELYDYCALVDDGGRVHPLEWGMREAAEAWLNQCFRTWKAWEGNGQGRAPSRWRPKPPELSPWDRGFQYYN